MSARGEQLQRLVDGQLERLGRVVAALDSARAAEPCPDRAKLGDGSIGAVTTHTVGNFLRIGGFVSGDAAQGHAGGHGSAGAFNAAALAHQLGAARAELGAIGALSDDELDAARRPRASASATVSGPSSRCSARCCNTRTTSSMRWRPRHRAVGDGAPRAGQRALGDGAPRAGTTWRWAGVGPGRRGRGRAAPGRRGRGRAAPDPL